MIGGGVGVGGSGIGLIRGEKTNTEGDSIPRRYRNAAEEREHVARPGGRWTRPRAL